MSKYFDFISIYLEYNNCFCNNCITVIDYTLDNFVNYKYRYLIKVIQFTSSFYIYFNANLIVYLMSIVMSI